MNLVYLIYVVKNVLKHFCVNEKANGYSCIDKLFYPFHTLKIIHDPSK